MGYSGRYHAASLAAVFVALAIGILIGVGLADDVVSGAADGVESALRSDLAESREESESLAAELAREREFGELIGPAVVAGRLDREGVGLFAIGALPEDETPEEAEEALLAGGVSELGSVAVIRVPPDLESLAEAAGGPFAPGRPNATPERLGSALGRQLVGGGPLIERVQEELFSSFSGDLGMVESAVLVSEPPEALDAGLSAGERTFISMMLGGIDDAAGGTVGIERSTADPTTLEVFMSAGIPTVDDVDRASGQVSTVLALLGADGDFGSKEAATSLVPELTEQPSSP